MVYFIIIRLWYVSYFQMLMPVVDVQDLVQDLAIPVQVHKMEKKNWIYLKKKIIQTFILGCPGGPPPRQLITEIQRKRRSPFQAFPIYIFEPY